MKRFPERMDKILGIRNSIEKVEIIPLLEMMGVWRKDSPFCGVLSCSDFLFIEFQFLCRCHTQERLTPSGCRYIGRPCLEVTFQCPFMAAFTQRKHPDRRHEIIAETEDAERNVAICRDRKNTSKGVDR
jgi:hypothetical protein